MCAARLALAEQFEKMSYQEGKKGNYFDTVSNSHERNATVQQRFTKRVLLAETAFG
jgi:hypothetical protein